MNLSLDVNTEIYFFSNENFYILYSGTSLHEEEDAFRHLNDLYLMLLMLLQKGVTKDNILLVIDLDILHHLDTKTKGKLINDLKIKDFLEISTSSILDINDFPNQYIRDVNKDLIFISSGHGSIHGLYNSKNDSYLSSDYFEDIATVKKRTILLMSQCIAGSFHHLDTRKNICTIGASEYQNSLSLDLLPLCKIFGGNANSMANSLSFFPGVAINPFLFSFFCVSLHTDVLLRYNSKKNLIHIYKYTASSTYSYLQNVQNKIDFELIQHRDGKTFVRSGYMNVIQTPYLLNKILASNIIFS